MDFTIRQQDLAIQKPTPPVQQQATEIASLKAEPSIYKNKKNSGNSHIPHSKDENRSFKNQSLRTKSGKRLGGQPGYEGATLYFSATPDEVVNHLPSHCNCCGRTLGDVPAEFIEARRVIDIPPIKPICTAHFKCEAEGHQICMAHLLHDIQYIHELYPGLLWSKDFKNLIHQTLQLKQTLDPVDCYRPKTQRTTTQKRLGQLLTEAIDTQYPQAITLQKNLHKQAGHILTFFDHPKVTPDNNASERAIKNIKVKQKISGQFKSEAGDQAFAVLRSVINTAIKNTQNALAALYAIAGLNS